MLKNKNVLVVIAASGFNEQEFLSVKKVLEQKDYKVFIASDAYSVCSGMNGMKIKADVSFYNMNERNFCGLIIIGGTGITKYFSNMNLHRIINKFNQTKKIIGAICGAPVILAKAGILIGKNAVCWPELIPELIKAGVNPSESEIVADQNIITAAGPQSSTEFGYLFVSKLEN